MNRLYYVSTLVGVLVTVMFSFSCGLMHLKINLSIYLVNIFLTNSTWSTLVFLIISFMLITCLLKLFLFLVLFSLINNFVYVFLYH